MSSPIVSIIIPTYGGSEFLKRCVDSVLAQTYPNIEVIVVDDNGVGTPNQIETSKVMDNYIDNAKVKYVCHEHNINGSAARNTGFKNSHGEYIALLDDDDIFYPTNIEEHVKVLSTLDDTYALTYCSGEDEFTDTGVVRTMMKTFTGQDLYSIMMHRVTISSSTICIKRNVWEALGGFDESFRRHQDWEFTARVMANYKVYALQHIGYRRFRLQRNLPTDPNVRRKYIEHYLDRLTPIIQTLSNKQQKDVIISNRFTVCRAFIKRKQLLPFIKEYWRIHPGYRGILYTFTYIFNGVKRKNNG